MLLLLEMMMRVRGRGNVSPVAGYAVVTFLAVGPEAERHARRCGSSFGLSCRVAVVVLVDAEKVVDVGTLVMDRGWRRRRGRSPEPVEEARSVMWHDGRDV